MKIICIQFILLLNILSGALVLNEGNPDLHIGIQGAKITKNQSFILYEGGVYGEKGLGSEKHSIAEFTFSDKDIIGAALSKDGEVLYENKTYTLIVNPSRPEPKEKSYWITKRGKISMLLGAVFVICLLVLAGKRRYQG